MLKKLIEYFSFAEPSFEEVVEKIQEAKDNNVIIRLSWKDLSSKYIYFLLLEGREIPKYVMKRVEKVKILPYFS